MNEKYIKAAEYIKAAKKIVFFTGAGVSTECGIPDFRGNDGLYRKKNKYNVSPETILSHSYFEANPKVFYEYIKENILGYKPLPNKGHKAIACLEKTDKSVTVVTQNIDGLHQAAGSKNVLELHGNLVDYYCSRCFKRFSSEEVLHKDLPLCECGGVIRPDIVLYEEQLNENTITKSIEAIEEADLLIVAGTSLSVYPAAGFIKYFRGNGIIFINKDSTDYDSIADIIINDPFAVTMYNIMKYLGLWEAKTNIVNPKMQDYKDHPSFKGVEIMSSLEASEGLGVKSNYALIKPGFEISPHTHDVVEVFTILSGHPQVLIDGDWMLVEKGTVVAAYPGEVHGVRNSTEEPVLLHACFKA